MEFICLCYGNDTIRNSLYRGQDDKKEIHCIKCTYTHVQWASVHTIIFIEISFVIIIKKKKLKPKAKFSSIGHWLNKCYIHTIDMIKKDICICPFIF